MLRKTNTTMKKTIAILASFAVAVGAFAQGKVTFGNGATHPVTIDSRVDYAKGNATLAGTLAPQIGAPNDVLGLLTAQLLAGTSAGSLTLQATFAPAGQAGFDPGILLNSAVTLTGVPAGPAFFQILLFETTAGSFAAASGGQNFWYGSTEVFSATAGSFAPTPLSSSTGWPAGPIILSANPIPEPSTFVLAGLGVASLLLFRRRK